MKNIVLCCAAGMSTSMLVQRMQDAAQKKGVEVSIKAVPVAELKITWPPPTLFCSARR